MVSSPLHSAQSAQSKHTTAHHRPVLPLLVTPTTIETIHRDY